MSDAPSVRPCTGHDLPAWNAFVHAHPEGTFFHRAEWQQVLTEAFGHGTHYMLAERSGAITGLLPLAEVKSRLFGHALVSTPFCVYGGVLSVDAESEAALVASACDLARQLGVDYLEMRNRVQRHPDWPSKDLYVTFRKAIDEDGERNLAAIPRKQRAVVRKGIKEGCRAEIDTDVGRHYSMYAESLRNLGTPVFSRRYLQILRDVFGDDCEILTVMHGAAPIASCLSFYFRDEVLPYYGGGTLAARSVGGNDFMYWEIMERARQRGCRVVRLRSQQARHRVLRLQAVLGLRTRAAVLRILPGQGAGNAEPESDESEVRPDDPLVAQVAPARHPARRPAGREVPGMSEILFLAHRIPYPPNKGDKIRSWHLLKGLARALQGARRNLRGRPGRLAARRQVARGLR